MYLVKYLKNKKAMVKIEDLICSIENVIASDGNGRKLISVTHIEEVPSVSFYIEDHAEVVYETRNLEDAILKFNS